MSRTQNLSQRSFQRNCFTKINFSHFRRCFANLDFFFLILIPVQKQAKRAQHSPLNPILRLSSQSHALVCKPSLYIKEKATFSGCGWHAQTGDLHISFWRSAFGATSEQCPHVISILDLWMKTEVLNKLNKRISGSKTGGNLTKVSVE